MVLIPLKHARRIVPPGSCSLVSSGGRLIVMIALACLMARPAYALTCEERLIQMTVECMGGDLSKAPRCRDEAERKGCGPDGDNRCEAEVKEDVDWVFRDKGALATYRGKINTGMSPFDAVVFAQGHNSPVQKQLKECRAYVVQYLASKGREPNEGTLPNRKLTSADCSCVSILPVSNRYRVTNDCDKMKITVQFEDAANTSRKAWIDSGVIGGGGSSTIAAPAYAIASIHASSLRNAASEIICRY